MHQASAAWEGKGGVVPWENPVDQPFSSRKDASAQQLCTTYGARIPGVLILSIYGKRIFFEAWQIPTFLFLTSSKTTQTQQSPC